MVFVLILLAVACRLLPHPPNFAPVAAVGLFAGAVLDRRISWLVPVVALLASDAVLGFYHPVSMFWNYAAYAASFALGFATLRDHRTFGRIAGATLGSALVFFVLSNFGMWASAYYPRTLAGLIECYTLALPFFTNTLLSNVVFSAALFGGYAFARRFNPTTGAEPIAS